MNGLEPASFNLSCTNFTAVSDMSLATVRPEAPALPWPGAQYIRIVPNERTPLDHTKRFGHGEHCNVTRRQ